MLLREYEISIWEDFPQYEFEIVRTNGENEIKVVSSTLELPELPEGEQYKLLNSWYEERCVAVIGSNTMTAENRAQNPTFTKKVNGSFELSFDLYYRYFDHISLDFVSNPFVNLLKNEQKIKLYLPEEKLEEHGGWYDFIIKNIDENSSTKTFTYIAKALFINELSKGGLEITYDPELENNIGTINELIVPTLEGTDWTLSKNSDNIQQTLIEPLYTSRLRSSITAHNILNKTESIEIAKNAIIYIFYSCVENKESQLQFLYNLDNIYTIDTDTLAVNNSINWILDISYEETANNYIYNIIDQNISVTDQFRGKKYIRSVRKEYNSVLGQYTTFYDNNDGKNEIRGFTKTEYLTPEFVFNLLTNNENFTDDQGWSSDIEGIFNPAISEPPLKENATVDEIIKHYDNARFTLQYDVPPGNYIHNSGLLDNRSKFVDGGFSDNEEYVFNIIYRTESLNDKEQFEEDLIPARLKMEVRLFDGIDENGKFKFLGDKVFEDQFKSSIIFSYDFIPEIDKDGNPINYTETTSDEQQYSYFQVTATVRASRALSYSEMLKNKVGFFLTNPKSSNSEELGKTIKYVIEKIEFFKKYVINEEIVFPGNLVDKQVAQTYYYYYNKFQNLDAKTPEEYQFLYQGTEKQNYNIVYDDECTKRRSIKISKSNRFNIIQELCELFECWPRFIIRHEEDGRVKRDPITRKLYKQIEFKRYIGKDNFAGFKYGINSNSIQRTVASEQIVTKVVVEDNNNDLAIDGFCSIARSEENPLGERFLYDFRYYCNQGMLNFSELNNDLYIDSEQWMGYYVKLKRINKQVNEAIKSIGSLKIAIVKGEANVTIYKTVCEEASKEIANKKNEFMAYKPTKGYTYDQFTRPTAEDKENSELNNLRKDLEKDPEIIRITTAIEILVKRYQLYDEQRIISEKSLNTLRDEEKQLEELCDSLTESKKELHNKFYNKYSRFIQEGSWSSQDYLDDDLYYYDATAALAINANPQVNYNISVIDIGLLEGYEGYNFAVGDKTYIEDTEFFGWTYIDGVKTPVQEEIFVSEVVLKLESPNDNKITVQNYKTKFEDMFQRINTTTSNLEFQMNSFSKVTNVVTSEGIINSDFLQASFDRNAFTLSNSSDQSVIWDKSGITVSSPRNLNQLVRIVNGGIFITKDGGITWNSAITGAGINAGYITSGQIDTNVIRIINGSYPTFRWDSNGISAYSFTLDNNNIIDTINYQKFIRFDRFGLYGINNTVNIPDNWTPKDEIDIKQYCSFALTWDGFYLKGSGDTGFLEISKDDDIVFHSKFPNPKEDDPEYIERIRIGRLGEGKYGLRIKNDDNVTVLLTESDGSLWLKDSLNIETNIADNKVSIGKLGQDGEKYKVIDANGQFIVYEDGSFKGTSGYLSNIIAENSEFTGKVTATSGSFTGEIFAESGTIGGLEISEMENYFKGVILNLKIEPGQILKITNQSDTDEAIRLKANLVNTTGTYSWAYSLDFNIWNELILNSISPTTDTVQITYGELKQLLNNNDKIFFKCSVTNGEKIFTATQELTIINTYRIEIISSNGTIFKNNNGSTTLTCMVYVNEKEYTGDIKYQWYAGSNDIQDATNKTLEVSADDIEETSIYSCKVVI